MYQWKNQDDTIVAISTPAGTGGIGIIRLSGKKALAVAGEMFISKNGEKVMDFKGFSIHYGWIKKTETNDIIDEVLLTAFRAPKSYTAEDVVEISCHGGSVSVKAILAQAVELGARLAEPGEFTKRAFLNGRIDLVKAEAVLDIVNAQTDAFLRISTHQLKGELSVELERVREHLMNAYTEIEAVVNFPEDDIDPAGRRQMIDTVADQRDRIRRLLDSSHNGRILKEGVKVVLCGKPNVGKSSILNALLKQQRAIVTDIAGTTRDIIEEASQINGIPLILVDTAGILEPRDLIEEEAIKRSHLSVEGADLVLLVLDASRPWSDEDLFLLDKTAQSQRLILFNKADLPPVIDGKTLPRLSADERVLSLSTVRPESIRTLESAIFEAVWQNEEGAHHGIMISNLRHISALKMAATSLSGAIDIMEQGIAWEFASEEIKQAVNQLDGITGRNIDQDLLDRIFSQFCIGK